MSKYAYRFAGVISGLAFAGSAFAQTADTDGMIPAIDYTSLAANVTSAFGQAVPIGLVVAGLALALGLVGWVISTLTSVFRSRHKKV